jgi:FKBP-type peptidyl-prolyl cis-trans isomerase
MKSILYSLLALSLLITGCSKKETPGGVKYTVVKKGDGKPPAFGDFLSMSLLMKDSKDSVWFDSKTVGGRVILPVPDASMEKDPGEMGVFKILTKGDSVTFQLTAFTVFFKTRRMPVPENMDSTSLFTFTACLKDVMSRAQVDEYQQKKEIEMRKAQVEKDSVIINNLLAEKGIVAQSAAAGMRYVVKKEGKGPFAVSGQTALVHYAVYTLEGKLIDTSWASVAKDNNFDNGNRNEPYPVVVNASDVIRGWHEMLQLMNKGMKVTVYIPSSLAYGPQGRGPEIPPNSILLFDMEVMDVK